MHGGLTQTEKNSIIRKQQHVEEMQAEGGDVHWSPHNMDGDHHAGAAARDHKTYYTTKSSGVDGIVGKLGRLEAMILAQSSMGRKKKQMPMMKVAYPMKATTIDRIIYPVYTKKGLKYGKRKKNKDAGQGIGDQQQEHQEPIGKLLDGFLILYSCRVKLPHEAIKSKLASQKIVEVIEEDLCYF